jgi:hypothetical protein
MATYSISVTESGLPAGVAWNLSVTSSSGTAGTGGTAATLTVGGLSAGSYTVAVAVSFDGAGTRYVPGPVASSPVTVPTSGPLTVTFSTEYLVSVLASAGGSASPGGSEWLAAGATVALSESPSSGQSFQGWNGTGTDAYTGTTAAPTLTVNGPITETAAFGPAPTTGTANSSGTAFPTLGVALLVVLLVVGAVVGILLGRRMGGGSAAGPGDSPSEPPAESAPDEQIYGSPAVEDVEPPA